jgi:hypothetical protein
MAQLLKRSEAYGKGAGRRRDTLAGMGCSQPGRKRNCDCRHAEEGSAGMKFRPVEDQRVRRQLSPHAAITMTAFTMTVVNQFVRDRFGAVVFGNVFYSVHLTQAGHRESD